MEDLDHGAVFCGGIEGFPPEVAIWEDLVDPATGELVGFAEEGEEDDVAAAADGLVIDRIAAGVEDGVENGAAVAMSDSAAPEGADWGVGVRGGEISQQSAQHVPGDGVEGAVGRLSSDDGAPV